MTLKQIQIVTADGTGMLIEAQEASDGYHTFDELYEHRIALFIALCRTAHHLHVWRSKLHADGTSFDGWFIMGIGTAIGRQITYHLPMTAWAKTEFADTLDRAPEWDGHTTSDVLARLDELPLP